MKEERWEGNVSEVRKVSEVERWRNLYEIIEMKFLYGEGD
jgi:hypothetical protein